MMLKDFINKSNDIVLGYIGGSITEGKKYTTPVTNWFKNTFENVNFTEINAGVGGTGSFLGVCRSEHDLISMRPDIVFIEFAVNDYSLNPNDLKRNIEGIIRKVFKKNPFALIIMIYTTTGKMIDEHYKIGTLPQSVEIQNEVAKYYNIPSINVGKALFEKCGDNILNYLPDSVHPNDEGGKVYADYIIECLDEFEFEIKNNSLPMYADNSENAAMIFPQENDLWKKSAASMYNKLQNYVYSCTPGTEMALEFKGRFIGLYCTIEKDSGDIEYCIDGGEWKSKSTFDEYAIKFGRPACVMLETELEDKEHTLKLKVSDNKNGNSEGNYIRIGAFLTAYK